MMRRRQILAALPISAAAALAGCGSAPTYYYRIIPVPGAVLQTGSETIQVREIGIPDYLDQNGIATPSGTYQFAASANDLWAEPFANMLQSVLIEDLSQRLPQVTATASNGMVGAPASLVLEINVLRFDPDPSGRIELDAQIALKNSSGEFLDTRKLQTGAAPQGPGMPEVMAVMSKLWGGLADAAAQAVAQVG